MRASTRTAGILLATGALVLSGCGREECGAQGGAEASDVAEGQATGTVSVWAMGTEGENLDALAAGFEETNPDVAVEVTAIPWDAAHDKIATSIAGGQTPDISLIGTTWMGEFAETGALDPTPDLIDPADFFEGAWNTTVVNDTSYGVPWYVETRLIYYRTDLADKAGVQPPTTWEDMKTFTQGLQEAGADYGISLPPGETGAWQTFLPFAWQNGAELMAEDAWTLDTPEMTEALDYYKSFFTEGIAPDALTTTLESDFANGVYGSFISGPWHMGLLAEQGGDDFADKWDVAPMPAQDSGTSFVGGGDLVVFSGSPNRDAAWKFLQYLTQPDVQSEFYTMVGSLPSVQAAWDSGELAEDPQLATFGAQLEDAKSPPPSRLGSRSPT
jgi:multiple sugar transport system substrate-binding protein